MEQNTRTARDVIMEALTARHEELSGEASPLDFDGTSQILRALGSNGFVVVRAAEILTAIDPAGLVEETAGLGVVDSYIDAASGAQQRVRQLFAERGVEWTVKS